MSDDILNRIDDTIAQYVDWDGHSEDSVRQLEDGTVIDTRTPDPARALTNAVAEFWDRWVESFRPAYEAICKLGEGLAAQQRSTFERIRPPRAINPTRARSHHHTSPRRGGHRG